MRQKNLNFWERLGNFARKDPVLLVGIILFLVIGFCWLMNSFELWPEKTEPTLTGAAAFDKGDSMMWIGMEVTPVSRSIRKDFKIPRRIKGMFVLNEGLYVAKKYGVKTGDIILSIGRKRVFDINSFVNTANNARYMDGILLEIYRDRKTTYLTIPFEYQYGPLAGPYKGSWQMGTPVYGPVIPYGPLYGGNNNQAQTQTQNL